MDAAIPVVPSVARQHSSAEVAAMAKTLYASGAALRRRMQQLRPYACPVEVLLSVSPENGSVLDVGCGSGLFRAAAVVGTVY